MKKISSVAITLLLLSILFTGCQSKDFKEPGIAKQHKRRTERLYRANFQKTWDAVNQSAAKFPIASTRKETGTIITDWIKGKSDRLYSGYGETRVPYTIRYKFRIQIKPSSKGTIVKIASKEQYLTDSVSAGIDFSGSVYQWLDTPSSTLKEADFLDEIGKLVSHKR